MDASTKVRYQASDDFINQANIEVFPQIHEVLGKIDALLSVEDQSMRERICPMLKEMESFATHLVNPLMYGELSAKLTRLAGNLTVRAITTPKVFVGYRYDEEDVTIVEKFIKLFRLEGFNPISGEVAKPMNVDEKVKGLIDECEGTIIISTRDRPLNNGKWTASVWLKGEESYSLGRDKPILLFYDDCIDEEEKKGIQGNLEYVVFKRECLDDAILKAIPIDGKSGYSFEHLLQ